MPKSGDAFLATNGLPLSHDPRNRVSFQQPNIPIDTSAIFDRASQFFTDYGIQVIKDLTGIDISTWNNLWDSLAEQSDASQKLVESIIAQFVVLINPLFGNEEQNNLLAAGGFKDAISLSAITGWSWDGAVGRTGLGAAKATPAGGTLALLSNPIAVAAGQLLDFSVWLKWSAVTATGTAFKLDVTTYNGASLVGTTTIDSVTDPATNQSSWLELSDVYTVPSGVTAVRARLAVQNTSAGSVWFDDASVVKTTLLRIFMQQLNDFLWIGWTGLPASGQSPVDVGAAAAAQREMLAAQAKSVASLKQQLIATQQAAGGNAIAMADDPFDGSGAMTANWDVRYLQPLSGGTVVRNGGQLVWSGFGVTEREAVCRWRGPNPVSLTDNQRVSIVLGSPLTSPSATASDHVVVRCNSAKTTYVKVKFRPTALILVAVVNDVETVIATQTVPRQAVGTVATVEPGTPVGPRWFKIKLGTAVYDINDSGAVSQYGSSFRGWGLGMYAQSILISQVFPGAIDYWQATDNPDMLSPLGDDSTTNYSGGNAASAGLGYISGGDALDAGAGIISGGHA